MSRHQVFLRPNPMAALSFSPWRETVPTSASWQSPGGAVDLLPFPISHGISTPAGYGTTPKASLSPMRSEFLRPPKTTNHHPLNPRPPPVPRRRLLVGVGHRQNHVLPEGPSQLAVAQWAFRPSPALRNRKERSSQSRWKAEQAACGPGRASTSPPSPACWPASRSA